MASTCGSWYSSVVHRSRTKLGVWVHGWVAVFSPNDMLGLRRPKNVKFGTKVASSIRMMHALRFLEKVF